MNWQGNWQGLKRDTDLDNETKLGKRIGCISGEPVFGAIDEICGSNWW